MVQRTFLKPPQPKPPTSSISTSIPSTKQTIHLILEFNDTERLARRAGVALNIDKKLVAKYVNEHPIVHFRDEDCLESLHNVPKPVGEWKDVAQMQMGHLRALSGDPPNRL